MLDKCVFKLLQDFTVKEFFSYESLNARKEEKLNRRANYKKRIRFAVKFFLSYESLNSRKQRTFYTTSYLQGPWKYGKAKEAVESTKAGLTLLERA